MEYPNWFEMGAKSYFENLLADYKDKPDLKFLQLGAYLGHASQWLHENILTGENSILVDVDTWKGSEEDIHRTFDWQNIFNTYISGLQKYGAAGRHAIFPGTTEHFFASQAMTYDFIYIDADHTAQAVYRDAINSWKILKPGGLLAFDDYTWGDGLEDQSLAPKPGIDKFLAEYKGEYKQIAEGSQVWVRKSLAYV